MTDKLAVNAPWLTVIDTARYLGCSRWAVLMACLHGDLTYRPTTNGVEVKNDRKLERRHDALFA